MLKFNLAFLGFAIVVAGILNLFGWLIKAIYKELSDQITIPKEVIVNTDYAPYGKRHFGILFRWQSFWVGCHYSIECKRYCLNIIPCLTIWWTARGGLPVLRHRM